MEIRNAYKQKMLAQLQEWGAQINLLEAEAENAGADIRLKHAKALQALRARQQTAVDQLKQLETASSEGWEQLKDATDEIWRELKTAITDTRSKFK